MAGGDAHIEGQIVPLLHNGISFIDQDQPSNQNSAEEIMSENGLASRVEYEPHNFFATQRILQMDVSRPCTHSLGCFKNSDNIDAVSILKPLVPAMERFGTKLWIMNAFCPTS